VGNRGEAIEHLSAAVRLDNELAETHNNLGIVMTRMGRRDDAVNEFKTARQIDPACTDAQDNLARAIGARK
jgi:Flp pilus assembly protein TadD